MYIKPIKLKWLRPVWHRHLALMKAAGGSGSVQTKSDADRPLQELRCTARNS